MAEDTLAMDHIMADTTPEGAVALCGERAYAGHPLMFGTGSRGVPQCPACLTAASVGLIGKTMPAFTATATVGKRMADGTPVE